MNIDVEKLDHDLLRDFLEVFLEYRKELRDGSQEWYVENAGEDKIILRTGGASTRRLDDRFYTMAGKKWESAL